MKVKDIEFIKRLVENFIPGRLTSCKGDKEKINKEFAEFIKLINSIGEEENKKEFIEIANEFERILINEYSGQDLQVKDYKEIFRNFVMDKYTRPYDKSKIINPDMLASIKASNGEDFKAVRYFPKEERQIYKDEKVTIELLGSLCFKHATTLADYIDKYRVTKGEISYEIYSTIDVKKLGEDKLYKEAVVKTLLGEKNIKLSNCSGYIGFIDVITENKESPNNINEKYCLSADSVEATAVNEYAKMKERFEAKKPKKNGLER